MLVEILTIIPLDYPKSLLAGLHLLFSSLLTTTIRRMVLGQVKVLGTSQLHLGALNASQGQTAKEGQTPQWGSLRLSLQPVLPVSSST